MKITLSENQLSMKVIADSASKTIENRRALAQVLASLYKLFDHHDGIIFLFSLRLPRKQFYPTRLYIPCQ